MQKIIQQIILMFLVSAILNIAAKAANESTEPNNINIGAFSGQDLYLAGQKVETYSFEPGGHILAFRNGFELSMAQSRYTSDKAVLWIQQSSTSDDRVMNIKAYLQGNVKAEKMTSAISTDSINQGIIEQGNEIVLWFNCTGLLFIEDNMNVTADPRGLKLYADAFSALREFNISPAALEVQPLVIDTESARNLPESTQINEDEPEYTYPITISRIGTVSPDVQIDLNNKIATIIGKFYISQVQESQEDLLELQADNAVIFLLNQQAKNTGSIDEMLASGAVQAIYLAGDVIMTQGQRTIRADEIYYDFQSQQAIANNVEVRTFDENAGIPIYIRAKKLQQLAENSFVADDGTLTTSEFHTPQISLNASRIELTDTASTDSEDTTSSRTDFDVKMQDIKLKYYDTTLFYLPSLRSNMQRPDTALKNITFGNDSTNGIYAETRWYFARLLGLNEPEGTDSTLMLDYYDERGPAGGLTSTYETEDYFGKVLGYIIQDHGLDDLGRQRKNLEPDQELRGRFSWRHRQFLPYNWQLTTEVSYLSDENFLESFYRSEYNLEKEQETLLYLKRIEDNRAFTILGKIRINDFTNELEELPTSEFHLTGQSFWDDNLTFYSDTQASRLRRQYPADSNEQGFGEFYNFVSSRNEIDMPVSAGGFKIVPFIAATGAYEDGTGFYYDLDGTTIDAEDTLFSGEAGIRLTMQPYWKVMPYTQSKLLDLNQLRHVIRPYLTAVGYIENDPAIEQRDIVNVGVTQQLQTKRGQGQNERTVDWMRLDTNFTFLNNSDQSLTGADYIIWNRPYVPLINELSATTVAQDRRGSGTFGPRNNYFGADYTWNISDTTALLSDLYYDLHSTQLQQFNVGFARMRWPNLSYYVGSRFLRQIQNEYGQKGSNALTFALTYLLDTRYTLVYSGQYDFDYDSTVRNDLTLIRKYHRLFWSLTYSTDTTLDRHSVSFSLWPQGLADLAIGPSRYMNLGGSAGL